jgi:hypothetical protein
MKQKILDLIADRLSELSSEKAEMEEFGAPDETSYIKVRSAYFELSRIWDMVDDMED